MSERQLLALKDWSRFWVCGGLGDRQLHWLVGQIRQQSALVGCQQVLILFSFYLSHFPSSSCFLTAPWRLKSQESTTWTFLLSWLRWEWCTPIFPLLSPRSVCLAKTQKIWQVAALQALTAPLPLERKAEQAAPWGRPKSLNCFRKQTFWVTFVVAVWLLVLAIFHINSAVCPVPGEILCVKLFTCTWVNMKYVYLYSSELPPPHPPQILGIWCSPHDVRLHVLLKVILARRGATVFAVVFQSSWLVSCEWWQPCLGHRNFYGLSQTLGYYLDLMWLELTWTELAVL